MIGYGWNRSGVFDCAIKAGICGEHFYLVAFNKDCAIDKFNRKIYIKTSEVGCVDGMKGKFNGSVEGLSYIEDAKIFKKWCEIYQNSTFKSFQ